MIISAIYIAALVISISPFALVALMFMTIGPGAKWKRRHKELEPEDLALTYISYDTVKMDKQKALSCTSMNYLFEQKTIPKTEEPSLPLPTPLGRKFR